MLGYLTALFIAFFCAIIYDINRKKRYKSFWWNFLFIYLTLFMGLRFEVGGDTINYMNNYIWRPSLSDWEFNIMDSYQPAYTILCAIGHSLSDEFFVFQLIHSLIFNGLLFFWLWRNASGVFSSLLALFVVCYLYFSTEILREALAVIIFLYNYKNLVENKYLKYYIGITICCLFHISAIFLVVLPFLKWIKFDKKYLILLLCSIIFSLFLSKGLSILATIQLLESKIGAYIELNSLGLKSAIFTLLRLTLFPIAYGFFSKFFMKTPIRFENIIAIMGLIGILSFFNPIIFSRASNYFIIFFTLSLSDNIVHWIKSKSIAYKHNSIIIAICFLLVYGSNYILYNKYTLWIPYYSIFNPKHVEREFANKMLLN